MIQSKKITARIPVKLLHKVQSITGKGITETLKIALEHLARMDAYKELRNMRGQVKFSNDRTL